MDPLAIVIAAGDVGNALVNARSVTGEPVPLSIVKVIVVPAFGPILVGEIDWVNVGCAKAGSAMTASKVKNTEKIATVRFCTLFIKEITVHPKFLIIFSDLWPNHWPKTAASKPTVSGN